MGNYHRGGYHSHHPAWRNHQSLDGGHIGVEFEVEASGSWSSYSNLLRLLPDFPTGTGPITESDGSLDYERGVEIVFPPVPYEELKKATGVFGQCIRALHGHTRHNSNTGMHMNVNVRGWTRRKIGLFLALINNLSDAQLRNVGGRNPTGYCRADRNRSLESYSAFGATHGRAAEQPTTTRLELRFPQSSTDPKRIELLVDFIERLDKFTDTVPDDWQPNGGSTTAGGQLYSRQVHHYDYTELFARFYKYLNLTKKGRRVLRVITGGFDEIDNEPEEKAAKPKSVAQRARNLIGAAA